MSCRAIEEEEEKEEYYAYTRWLASIINCVHEERFFALEMHKN